MCILCRTPVLLTFVFFSLTFFQDSDNILTSKRVLELLNDFEYNVFFEQLPKKEGFLPIALDLITNDKLNDHRTTRLLSLVSKTVGDRSSFVQPTIKLLSKKDMLVLISAIELLGNIGDDKCIQPIILFLSDKNASIIIYAAESLSKIGNKDTITVFDVWLDQHMPGNEGQSKHIHGRVKKFRDELSKRLESKK